MPPLRLAWPHGPQLEPLAQQQTRGLVLRLAQAWVLRPLQTQKPWRQQVQPRVQSLVQPRVSVARAGQALPERTPQR